MRAGARVRGVAWSILGGSGPLDSGSNPDGPIIVSTQHGGKQVFGKPQSMRIELQRFEQNAGEMPSTNRCPVPFMPAPPAGLFPFNPARKGPGHLPPFVRRVRMSQPSGGTLPPSLAPPRSLRTASGPPDREAEVARQDPEGPHRLRLPGPTNPFQLLSASMTRCGKVPSLLRWQALGEGTFIL